MKRFLFYLCLLLVCASLCTVFLVGCKQPSNTQGNEQAAVVPPAVVGCEVHVPGEWSVTKEATETKSGERRRVCHVCGELLEIEVIPATGTPVLAFTLLADGSYGVQIQSPAACPEHITVPALYKGAPVTQILPQGFGTENAATREACTSLKSIALPDSITVIGDHAFAGCSSLEEIDLPAELLEIGCNAFYACATLRELTLPSTLQHVRQGAFAACTALQALTLPEGVLTLESNAFAGCAALQSLQLPSTLSVFGGSLGDGCEQLQYSPYNGMKYLGNESNPYLFLIAADTTNTTLVLHTDTKWLCNDALRALTAQHVLVLPTSLLAIGTQSTAARVYFKGDSAAWNEIAGHASIAAEQLYFYRSTQPNDSGRYWHYVTGKPTAWDAPST